MRFNGLRVVIYPSDHRPAHVHVVGPGREAVFILNAPDGPVSLSESIGFRLADIHRIETELNRNLDVLQAAWEQIHGND
ncbi:MAG: DUF4160 domain-containing protein [Alphaproteobacteria bacterium]|nr:DUF4160 domain-containing protein [Alphaproteobacteria bacterium]